MSISYTNGCSCRGQIRVLHINDDPGFLRLTAQLLGEQNEQFDIVSKSNAEEATTYLASEDTDVEWIVSDYALSGLDGVEILKTVRASHQHLPFILFTGQWSEPVASEALTNGPTDYLQK